MSDICRTRTLLFLYKRKTCGEGQQIAVDVQNQRWQCVNEGDYPCPGGVEFFCPEDPVLTGLNRDIILAARIPPQAITLCFQIHR